MAHAAQIGKTISRAHSAWRMGRVGRGAEKRLNIQGVTWTALGIPTNASSFKVSHGPLGGYLTAPQDSRCHMDALRGAEKRLNIQGVTWTALGIPTNASTSEVSHGPLGGYLTVPQNSRCHMDALSVQLSVRLSVSLTVCLMSLCPLQVLFFFVSGVERVPVLGIKKPVAQNVLQPYPRTPDFNVEVVGTRLYTGQGE